MCNQKGYCWTGNAYFAKLYGKSESSIKNWIRKLRDAGHISISFSYKPGKKEVQERHIRLTCTLPVAKQGTKKSGDSENSSNGKNEYPCSTDQEEPQLTPRHEAGADTDVQVGQKSDPGGSKNCPTWGKNLSQVGQNFDRGGSKNCLDNITYNITNNNSSEKNVKNSAASAPSEAKPPGKEAEDLFLFSAKELKDALAKIDPALFLQNNFFNRAPPFMAKNSLGIDYLQWIYDQCRQTDFRSLKDLFFSMFFDDSKPLEFKASNAPKPPPKPPPDFPCPVCEHVHPQSDELCPSCNLPARSSQDLISLLRKLPPEKRKVYLKKSEDIAIQCGVNLDFVKYQSLIAELDREFFPAEEP